MRQASTLSFVSLTQNTDTTEVSIDARGIDLGVYSLILESFNTLSIAQSTLKTDTIEITVILG